MASIFHYTSVESLALILDSGNFRFSRLDTVDDVEEAQSILTINWGKFFFVSCWTRIEEESIPQWKMYGAGAQGVRIELPIQPFKKLLIPAGTSHKNVHIESDIYLPFSFEQMITSDCLYPLAGQEEWFSGPVQYVPDMSAEYSKAFSLTPDGVSFSNLHRLPMSKHERWKFQDEYRFQLMVIPRVDSATGKDIPPNEALFRGVAPTITYLDLELSEDAIRQIKVRAGPLMTKGQRICVQSLLDNYAPGVVLEDSHLAGLLRK